MLMLQRNQGQFVILENEQGEQIKILLDHASKRWGKIGIDAPKNWRIFRPESEAKRNEGKLHIHLPGLPETRGDGPENGPAPLDDLPTV